MKHHLSKFLSLLLVTAMLLQLLPASVFATESTDEYLNTLAEERPETAEEALDSAQILFEEESLREESVKHFRLDDGTYIAVNYGTPVHYEDDGEWVDYDNTLKAVNSLDGSGVSCYRVDNGDSTRVFAAEADADALLVVQKDDYGLAFAPVQEPDAELPIDLNQPIIADDTVELAPNATVLEFASSGAKAENDLLSQAQPDKIYSALEYENAINGATLRYENYGNTIKESIVISEPQSEYVYSFTVETDGLTAELQEDGSVTFATEDGTVVYYIPAPYMIDANNEYSYDAAYDLVGSNGTYTLTVTADSTWLNDETRTFPVLLDPTITETNLDDESVSATYINSGYSGSAATDTGLYVGDNGNENAMMHTLIHINDLIKIPDCSEITSVSFALKQQAYLKKTNGASSLDIALYPMYSINGETNPDYETSRWQNLMNVVAWNNVHGNGAYYVFDEDTLITDVTTVSTATTGDLVRWDITLLARQWYEDPTSNVGFILKPTANTATSRATFTGPESASNKPQFAVSYRNVTGIEPYKTYQTAGIGRAGTAYISDASLTQTTVVPLISSDSTVMPFSLSLIYNSTYGSQRFTYADNRFHTKSFTNMKLGFAWKLSAQQTVVAKTISGLQYLIYTDGDGTEHYFLKNGTAYYDEDGLNLKITVSGTDYTMTDDYDNKWFFDEGYLTRAEDAYGNKIEYVYSSDHRLTEITRTNNGCTKETLATLIYNSNNYVTDVKDEAGRTISFSYSRVNTQMTISACTFADEAVMQYGYGLCDDGESRLTSAYDSEAGYGMEFKYAADGTVKSFAEYVGTSTSKTYGAQFTAEKLAHNQTCYHYYGSDGVDGSDGADGSDADDIFTYKVLDRMGRTINSYSLDINNRVLGVDLAAYTANSGTSKTNNRITANASAGQQSVNLIKNASIENANVNATTADGWNLRTGGATIGNVAYLGNLSLRLNSASTSDGLRYWEQNVSLAGGKTYTFSAYVRIPTETNFATGGAVYLSLIGQSTTTSERINYSTTNIGSGWVRLTATAKITANCTAKIRFCASGFSGSVYADAFQLEEGDCASTFNIVEDGSFEHTSSFGTTDNGYWYESADYVSIASGSGTHFGTKVLHLRGQDGYQRISRSIPVKAKLSSTFILSAWAKAAADPTSAPTQVSSGTLNPYFGLILRFYYSDGTSEAQYFPFDTHCHDWQYMQGIAVPKKEGSGITIDSITIVVAYDDNINEAYFDNVAFRMEPVQTFRYDEETGKPIAATETGTGTESAVYDGVDLTKYTAANGNTTTYTYYDEHDIKTAVTDGVTNTFDYDDAGNMLSSVLTATGLKMSSTATYSTEDRNHVKTETDTAGNTTSYTYNSATEMLSSSTNANGTTNYTFLDGSNRPQYIIRSGLGTIGHSYQNGLLRHLTRKSFRNGTTFWQRYTFLNNAWGQQTGFAIRTTTNSSDFGIADPIITYTYEPNGGNLTQTIYVTDTADPDTISYTYDNLDRLTKTVYNDTGTTVNYYYNSEGALAKMTYVSPTSETTVYTFEYDSLDRLIRSTQSLEHDVQQRTEHIYDGFNRLSSQSYTVGDTTYTESYTYSDGASGDGTITKMMLGDNQSITYSYDALKRLTTKTVKNGSNTVLKNAYAYKPVTLNGESCTTPLVEFHNVKDKNDKIISGAMYDYDELGNIKGIYESVLVGTNTERRPLATYEYDDQNQLETEEIYTYASSNLTANPSKTTTYTYTYDTAGNILTATGNGATKTYAYTDTYWGDKLTAVNGTAVDYDGVGNPKSYTNGTALYSLTWEHGRQLATAFVDGRDRYDLTFNYDFDGIRTKKVVNGVTHEYITQNGRVVRETIGTGTTAKILDFIYDESSNPCALIYTNGTATPLTYYYVLNLQGDVVKLVNANGESRAEYTYNAWGEILTATGTMAEINPLRYRGYYYDSETGWYYLQSRYYDPAMHRFINADSIPYTGQGLLGANMFAYCNNNPVALIDSSGHASYKNTIEKQENGSYIVTTEIDFWWSSHTYQYTISKRGLISFNFEENMYWSLVWRGNTEILAKAMYSACEEIDDSFLAWRTINGIDIELKLHYAAFKANILYDSSHEANIGGSDVDDNGWFFETANAASIVAKVFLTVAGSGYMLKNIGSYLV